MTQEENMEAIQEKSSTKLSSLDRVILSIQSKLGPAQNNFSLSPGRNIMGGIYVVTKDGNKLFYKDRVARFTFKDGKEKTLQYHTAARYLEGQLQLLRDTGTKIGEDILLSLASVEVDLTPNEDGSRLADVYSGTLQLKDFSEAERFILGHILY